MKAIPHPIPLISGIKVDFDYLDLPKIENNLSSSVFKGKFMYKDEPLVNPTYEPKEIPAYFKMGKPI